MLQRVLFCTLFLVAASESQAGETPFSVDSAMVHLRVIAGDIGPRPMGSDAERAAMQYAVARFREFGCSESYIMPVAYASGVNTRTGIAVGVLPGRTGRIIILGAHIDSAGPELPGADDNASGCACVLELARVLSHHDHESTFMFCLWGGEEEGLVGSKYFADHFDRMDSVVLMLQMDMADGSSTLEVFPDGAKGVSAPRWLAEAAYEVFYGELGYEGLVYPTHAASLNSLGGGFAGSDHEPFLAQGIPAMDFTADVSYPIHTQQDNVENFTASGLKRTGDVVLRLVERYDGGVPSRGTEYYYLLQLGSTPLFLSWPVVLGLVIASLILAAVAILKKRTRPSTEEGKHRIRLSGLKILLFVVFIQALAWMSETAVEQVAGYRFPWVGAFGWFVLLGCVWGLAGAWISLRLASAWGISQDAFRLYLRSLILLAVLTVGLLFAGPELALYPAWGLFWVAVAMLVRWRAVKILAVLMSPYLLVRLMFNEWLGLIQRGFTMSPDGGIAITIALVLVSVLLSLPFAYAAAGVYRDGGSSLIRLRWFRHPAALVTIVLIALVMSLVLGQRTVYGGKEYTNVRVEQTFRHGADSGSIRVTSAEYLRGVHLEYDGKDSVVSSDETSLPVHPAGTAEVGWLTMERGVVVHAGASADSLMAVHRWLELRGVVRPLSVELTYSSKDPFLLGTAWGIRGASGDTARSRTIRWRYFPGMPLHIPVWLHLRPGQSLTESLTVRYDTLAYPLRVKREHTNVVYRTVVTSRDTLTFGASGELAHAPD